MFYHPLKKGSSVVAIVDGYSISSFFAPKLRALGYKCIHIQSSLDIPAIYAATFFPQNYIRNIIYTKSNLAAVIDELKAYNTQYVLVGTESGVEFADLLSEKLGLLTNGTRCSEARRNKFQMIEKINEHNLATVDHIKSNCLEEILSWANQRLWPIVIKQLRGTGTEKVFFCYAPQDIMQAFKKILGTKDVLGNDNQEVLAESHLDGTQYLVNMVSVQGSHILSDLWEMGTKKLPGASVVHDYLRLLPSSFYLKNELVDYTRNVLDALEIRYGASHNEVFMTSTGPTLVEMAARIMGAVHPDLIAQCIGRSQLELGLASYLQPERFTERDMCDYKLEKHLLVKMLISSQSGQVKKINYLDEIKAMPSFVSMSLNTAINKPIAKTINLFTVPGTVYLCHTDESVVQKDYEKIAAIEQEMFEV